MRTALPVTCALVLGAILPAQENDVVLRALRDELTRSMARLRVDATQAPYFGAYTVEETDSVGIDSAFGAVGGNSRGRGRELSVQIRVGDYALDNTNFSGGGFDFGSLLGGRGLGGGGSIPLDDDYDALRHALWLATDASYHDAVETLEKKKAHIRETNIKERPNDFSRAEPVVAIGAPAKLQVDRDRWAATTRRVSAVFRDFPAVHQSQATFSATASTRWYVNSEGFRHRVGKMQLDFVVVASAQASDGMICQDFEVFGAPDEGGMPSEEILLRAAKSLGERLTLLAAAPEAEDYRGPVLFEGQAAAELFVQALSRHLSNPVEAVGASGPFAARLSNPFKDKIGKRVLAQHLTIVDDPTAREYGGSPILGGYEIDDDGMRAQKITLIENGTLKTFCASRVPSRYVSQSNGHSRGGGGAISTLFVQSSSHVAPAELRQKLVELGKAEDLRHVLVVRRLSNVVSAMMNPHSMMSVFGGLARGDSEVSLMSPILVYRVSVEDGKEELLRGASFGNISLRVLRDIEAAGDDARAWPTVRGFGSVGHVVAPSVLIKEIEMSKPSEERDKPPLLVNPFFEK